jgi:UDP-N-acetylglucosamine--N-acetylmuramyl-(pentapeptide) pyrophosphoryl-undecaprenol N-acetylglucosamine transferase
MKIMPLHRVIISGGGTGGHIFPAIAIANALKERYPNIEILFVGAIGKMEMEKVPAAGYRIIGLNIRGLQRSLSINNLAFPYRVLGSLLKAFRIIKEFKPQVAIGVGGYASGPLLYASTLMGVPSIIQEQNAYAGLTNKMLAKRVQKICVAFEGMERFFPKNKIVITGNPVRKAAIDIEGKKGEALQYFGLNPNLRVILIVGGSLGARTLNESIKNALDDISKANCQLIWQTGKMYFDEAKEAAAQYLNVHVFDFLHRMDFAFAASDIVISRAGASTVSEMALVGKACILVPSPNVAEDHQTKNAMALVSKNAALLVNDDEARQLLVKTALNLINDSSKRNELESNVKALKQENAADKIVNEIENLVA